MSKITCDVVKDMMPLCIDGVCSEDSKQLVERHINECASCKKLWESFGNPQIPDEIKESSAQTFRNLTSRIKKKNRRRTILIVLAAVSVCIVAMICFGQLVLELLSFGNGDYSTIDTHNYGIHQGHVNGEKENLRSGLYIFPKEISANAKNIEFLYACAARGFGVDYQQFLQCTYPDGEYQAEIDRLKNIQCEMNTRKGTVVNRVVYSDTQFSCPAYIAAYGGNGMFEYALCNEDAKTITYIYLQMTSNDKVAFGKEYLPIEYRNGKQLLNDNNRDNTNIYYYYLGNGVYQSFQD